MQDTDSLTLTPLPLPPPRPLPFETAIGSPADSDSATERLRAEIERLLRRGENVAALDRATGAARQFGCAGNSRGQATALFLAGMLYRHREDCPGALDSLQDSRNIWESRGDTDGVIRCLQESGGTCIQKADYSGAMNFFQECLAACERSGNQTGERAARSNIAALQIELGDCATGLEGLLRCLSLDESQGNTLNVVHDLHNIAEAYLLLGQPDEAVRYARHGFDLCGRVGESFARHELGCLLLSTLATAYQKQGRLDDALCSLEIARTLAGKTGVPWRVAQILGDLGNLFLLQGRFEEAQEALEQSLSLNRSRSHRFIYARALLSLGMLQANPDFGDRCEVSALRSLTEARTVAEESDSPTLLIPVYQALSDLYERRGDRADLKEAIACLRLLHGAERRLFNEESDRRIKKRELEKAQKDAEIARRDAEILHLRNREMEESLRETQRLQLLADARANTDALTGIPNRRAFDDCLNDEWERSAPPRRPFAIALFDIDYFKRINDTYGHGTGDRTLTRVAEILRACCRPGDGIARYGGEEFAVLFPETPLPVAREICERLRESVAAQDWSAVHPDLCRVTISGGIGAFPGNENGVSSPSDLLREADQNLYHAKHNGRNRIAIASLSVSVSLSDTGTNGSLRTRQLRVS